MGFDLSRSTNMSISLSAVSSPREHEPNKYARFTGCFAKKRFIVGIILATSCVILLLSPLCKSTAKLQLFAHICKYFGQKLQIFYLFRQFTPLSLVQYIGFLGHYGLKRKNNSFDSYNSPFYIF